MLIDYLKAQGKPYKPLRFPRESRPIETEDSESEEEIEHSDDHRNMSYDSEVILHVKQYRRSLGLEGGIPFNQ